MCEESLCFLAPLALRPFRHAVSLCQAITNFTVGISALERKASSVPESAPWRRVRCEIVSAPSRDSVATTEHDATTKETCAFFQCPRCGSTQGESVNAPPTSCSTCDLRFARTRTGYIDMVNERQRSLLSLSSLPSPGAPFRQALFQLSPVAFAYERGWRSAFARAGFPGPDQEADLALDFVNLQEGDKLLDVSCGTGILTRRLALGTPARVYAADISHAMLSEAVSRSKSAMRVPNISFVRADVSNLPFSHNVFDAVHAGAALHCWPCVQDGLREVRRILKPGGRFFATTFFSGAYFPDREPFKLALRVADQLQLRSRVSSPYNFFEPDQLEYILRATGFASVEVERRGGCAIIRCREREGSDS